MAWIRENTPSSARLVSMNPYTVALLAGRECLVQPTLPHARDNMALIRQSRVDYIHLMIPQPNDPFVVLEFPLDYQPALARWLDAQREAAPLFHDLDESAVVYRVAPPAADPRRPLDPARREKL